jgi:hypothetical protein
VVLKGIQEHGDVVVGKDVFAAGEVGAQQLRIGIEADEDHVQCGPRVPDVGHGLLGGGLAVLGRVLHESVDHGQLVLEVRARLHALEVGQRHRAWEQRDFYIRGGLLFGRRLWHDRGFVVLPKCGERAGPEPGGRKQPAQAAE